MVRLSGLLGVALLLFTAQAVFSAEAVRPLDRYSTEISRELAKTYDRHLRALSEAIPRCFPWVFIPNDGLGVRQRKGVPNDNYLSIWVWVEQYYTSEFAATPREGRASAMFQRYGLDLLKRLASDPQVLGDPALSGFAVVLTWQKPEAKLPPGADRIGEAVAVFMDRASVQKLFKRQLSLSEFLKRSMVYGFEGKQELGSIPLTVHEEALVYDLISPSPPETPTKC